MPDEQKLHDHVNRAARAQAMFDEGLLPEAFDKLQLEYYSAWQSTEPRDTDGRERLWHAATMVGKVRNDLKNMIAYGKLAQVELDQIAARDKRVRR